MLSALAAIRRAIPVLASVTAATLTFACAKTDSTNGQRAGATSKAGKPFDFAKLGARFATAMVECPDQTWPGYSWKDKNALVIAPGGDARLWESKTKAWTVIPKAELPAAATSGLYAFFEFRGVQTVSIYMTAEGPYTDESAAFLLAVHEGFHHWEQTAAWEARKQGSLRGTEYPILAAPRLYRRQLYDRLRAYFFFRRRPMIPRARGRRVGLRNGNRSFPGRS